MKNILLTDLLGRLKWPGSQKPLSRPAVYDYFDQLHITVKMKVMEGSRRERACVTEVEAARVYEAFKARHWRKFGRG